MKRGYKAKNRVKEMITLIILTSITMGIMYYLYISYRKIEINESEYNAEKISVSTNYGKTVEKEQGKSKNIADILEEVTKSVCGISKLQNTGSSILSMATETELGLGTGVIVSSNGYILSNSHVTGAKYSTCYITIEDQNTYRGTVVWSDNDLDLSITKITASNLPTINLSESKNIRVGETVYAIGNPIGHEFRKTVTSGIISAVNRTIKLEENRNAIYMSNLLQTDATINPGNSGGPLISEDGSVVGINSVKITSAEGIGFAVPIDVVKPVIKSFVNTGKFDEATLGIYGYDNTIARSLNVSTEFSKGVFVEQIIKGSSADGSGLLVRDVILEIDNEEIETINDLRKYIFSKSPGDEIVLKIARNKITKTIRINLKRK